MTAPKIIYLQLYDEGSDGEELEEATWCSQRISETDIAYAIVDGEEERVKKILDEESIALYGASEGE